ncbi:MAG TPA: SWIM zinc finger family protein, partial [Streptosporangiaceae bacterium]
MSDLPGFTEADLRRLAGNRSFERGVDYLDLVTDLDVAANEITATVRGSYDYAVLLETDSGRLSGDCSCPYGQEGNFCKHLVAVGLVVLRAGEDLPLAVAAPSAGRSAANAKPSIRIRDSPNTWRTDTPRPAAQMTCSPCAAPGSRRTAHWPTTSRCARR